MSSVALTRTYASRYKAPKIDRIDPRIFHLRYFAHCMDCQFCHDACCQYGADIEMPRVRALKKIRRELEAYLGVPASEWFRTDPDDFGIEPEPEYPGGKYTRTQVVELPVGRSVHNEEACVFLDPQGRGCRIHRFALERGIPVYDLKPMICMLFPLSFARGELIPAYEFELDGELVCEGAGETLYRAARTDVLYYFGEEMIAELDRLEQQYVINTGGRPLIPLPTRTA